MRNIARRVRLAVHTDSFAKTYLAAATALAVLLTVMDPTWWWLLIPLALYALTVLMVRIVLAVKRANATANEIFRDELG